MSSKNNKSSAFLVQGTILAIASIVSRIIGLLYRMPMTNIIGDLGNNYYSSAFEVYNIMLLISSYSLPIAVSKFVSGYRARKDFYTVRKIVRTAMVLSFSSGLLACLILVFGASFITTALKTPLAIYALLVLAPALVILSVMGVLRGLFQGMGTMMPTAISQVIEQVVNAIISVAAAYILFKRGLIIGDVLGNKDEYAAALGAAGGTLGTTMGALFGFLFVLLIYAAFRPAMKKMEIKYAGRNANTEDESYLSLAKILILTIVPVLLSTTIYNISGIIDQFIFKNVAAIQNYSSNDVDIWWGVFSGKYKVLINVPLAVASAMAASSVPTLTGAFANKDYKLARMKTNQAIRFVMVVALPCMVGIGVLASPIMQLLFNDSSTLARNLLWAGCISVAFYSLSTLTNGILQGINRLQEPVKNAIIALVLHVVFLLVLMFSLKLNIYAVVYANAFYAFVMCILNGRSIRKYLKYKQEILRTFIIPTIASLIMGILVWLVYFGGMKVLHINAVWCLLSIVVGVVVYAVSLLLLKGLTEEELLAFPKGATLLRLAKKLHLM